ncbi:phage protein [Xenorhabdus budapestensis]|uniref:phage protein n=1 Tax=Xenorhabdus budapestensis TaxID=290110 RepID=UPI003A85DFC3
MSKQWLRECKLIVADEQGEGINLSELKIKFNITRPSFRYPATGIFKIYNLNDETRSKIRKNEYKIIQFSAGYKDNSGQIFSGQIQYTYTGRDSPTDTYVVIQAGDGDQAYNDAKVNITISAGYTQQDVDRLLMRDIEKYGITFGIRPEFQLNVAPRGKVFFGMHCDEMNIFAKQNNAEWRYEDGQCHIIPKNVYLTEAVVLNHNTGLIGMPEQTIGAGINLKCLINPKIRPGTLIRLEKGSINETGLSTGAIAQQESYKGSLEQPAPIDPEGDYVVINVSYFGDTREKMYYMELICVAKSDQTLMSQAALATDTRQ